MDDCIICRLVDGRAPGWLVYRDEHAVCFLPEEVQAYGHMVIASGAHFADLFSTPAAALGRVIGVVKEMSIRAAARLGASGVNLLHASGTSAQQSVAHLHFHLIPRFEGDGLDAWPTFPPAHGYDKERLLELLRWPSPGGAA